MSPLVRGGLIKMVGATETAGAREDTPDKSRAHDVVDFDTDGIVADKEPAAIDAEGAGSDLRPVTGRVPG